MQHMTSQATYVTGIYLTLMDCTYLANKWGLVLYHNVLSNGTPALAHVSNVESYLHIQACDSGTSFLKHGT
jgi:hypothetical protein